MNGDCPTQPPLEAPKPTPSTPIIALSEAAEFLLCAVRALASGASRESHDVKLPMAFVRAKIAEVFEPANDSGGR